MNSFSESAAIDLTGASAFKPNSTPAKAQAVPLTVEQVGSLAWERFAVGFEEINQEQLDCFNRAKWGEERVERIIVREQGTILGGAIVLIFRLPATSRGIALVKWGPLWRFKNKPPRPENLIKILRALKSEFADHRGYHFSVLPHADPSFGELTTNCLDQLGFTQGWSLPDPDRYLVNVSIDPDELRQSLDQKWRYNLKKSQKHDLEIAYCDGEEGLEQFMSLYGQMLTRKQFHDSSAIDTLPVLMEGIEPGIRPRIIIVKHENTPTAAAVIDVSGERAVYLYGATDQRALGLRAGYAMHWWIATKLSEMPDVDWYDLGGGAAEAGLHQFKKGFVGKQGIILPTPPSYEYAPSIGAHLVGRLVFLLRDLKAAFDKAHHKLKLVTTK